jgi:hypothetical protein
MISNPISQPETVKAVASEFDTLGSTREAAITV